MRSGSRRDRVQTTTAAGAHNCGSDAMVLRTSSSLMLPNTPQAVIGYYGALKAGAIVVPMNPLYVSRELETQLVDSGSETIVALDLFYPRIQAVRERTPLKRVILTSVADFLPPVLRLLYPIKARLTGRWVTVQKRPPLYDFLRLMESVPAGSKESPSLPTSVNNLRASSPTRRDHVKRQNTLAPSLCHSSVFRR